MAIADLETIDRRLSRLEKEATVERTLQKRVDLFKEIREVVAAGNMVSRFPRLMARRDEFADLHLLTAKPVIYVFNSDESMLTDEGRRRELRSLVDPAEALFIDAQLEAELAELEPDDRREVLEEVDLDEPGLNAVIRAAYRTLGLQSFLTGGDKETRAWTIKQGASASEAAGEIHTDFERGFIAAEVIDYDELIEADAPGSLGRSDQDRGSVLCDAAQ